MRRTWRTPQPPWEGGRMQCKSKRDLGGRGQIAEGVARRGCQATLRCPEVSNRFSIKELLPSQPQSVPAPANEFPAMLNNILCAGEQGTCCKPLRCPRQILTESLDRDTIRRKSLQSSVRAGKEPRLPPTPPRAPP